MSTHTAAVAEFAKRGAISSLDYLRDLKLSSPTTQPENLFDFQGLLEEPGKFLPVGEAFGEEVAVIGAGNAGLAAAYLLALCGLKPVVYEMSNRVGGRSFTRPFGRDPKAVAELGSMRIPLAQTLIFYLLKRWGIKHHLFANPLVADTVLDIYGQQLFWDAKKKTYTRGPKKLIDAVGVVFNQYNAIIKPIIKKWDATQGHLGKRAELWKEYVAAYNNKSLYQILIEHRWTQEQIDLFGMIGIGSGGFDSFFTSSFLEVVRVEIQKLETEQQAIVGGTNQIPQHLWSEEIDCAHWGRTSVEKLNGGAPRTGIASIQTSSDDRHGPVTIVDVCGNKAVYKAVVLSASPRAIDMTLDINKDAFSRDVWSALRNIQLTASEKVFVLTRSAFWNEPGTKHKLYTTLTDQPPRQMYTFDSRDFGQETPAGVVCLSYSWAESALRYGALNEEQRVAVCLDAIEKMQIYGPPMRRKLEEEIIESVSICWENQYGYNGGYRMANPGQADQVTALHAQSLGIPTKWNNGLYLAGEALSWYGLSGWIDGAIKSGLQAAISAVLRVS